MPFNLNSKGATMPVVLNEKIVPNMFGDIECAKCSGHGWTLGHLDYDRYPKCAPCNGYGSFSRKLTVVEADSAIATPICTIGDVWGDVLMSLKHRRTECAG